MIATSTLEGSDSRVDWAGRVTKHDNGSVTFDWLGVTARIAVKDATFVAMVATCSKSKRCTRLKAYAENQNYLLYPTATVWVSREEIPNNSSMIWQGLTPTNLTLTVENIVGPQYSTGITSLHSFVSDGSFVEVPANKKLGGIEQRRMEFIGDSITAATNVVRPPGAPGCADQGYQSDWSQTYEGLLCHELGASCSTIAVGGKCVMRECGGLQMPDYYLAQNYADAPASTYDFGDWKPDAIFINLGTNDRRVIDRMDPSVGPASFIHQTVEFVVNATQRYNKTDIQFFLNAGPMENTTSPWTQTAIAKVNALGLQATFVDMTACCDGLATPDSRCDGCSNHPGLKGHYQMYLAALPVIRKVMGWGTRKNLPPPTTTTTQ